MRVWENAWKLKVISILWRCSLHSKYLKCWTCLWSKGVHCKKVVSRTTCWRRITSRRTNWRGWGWRRINWTRWWGWGPNWTRGLGWRRIKWTRWWGPKLNKRVKNKTKNYDNSFSDFKANIDYEDNRCLEANKMISVGMSQMTIVRSKIF